MTNESYLAHYGVKGMKWGVRRFETKSGRLTKKGKERYDASPDKKEPVINKDGSISIPKGYKMQRVVNRGKTSIFDKSDKEVFDIGKDITYASFTKKDNLLYEKQFGQKQGLLKDFKASEILTLTTTKNINSPPPKEAANMFLKTLKKYKKVAKDLHISDEEINDALLDKSGTKSHDLYTWGMDTSVYNANHTTFRNDFINQIKKSGYNALMDPMDAAWTGREAPMILLDSSSINVSGRRTVDANSQREVRTALREYDKINKGRETVLQTLGY